MPRQWCTPGPLSAAVDKTAAELSQCHTLATRSRTVKRVIGYHAESQLAGQGGSLLVRSGTRMRWQRAAEGELATARKIP
jgi:hypothetical protein